MRNLLEDAWECMTDPDDSFTGLVVCLMLWITVLETPILIWRFW